MGERNSALTRVRPVFSRLLERWPTGEPWLPRMWDMARETRPTAVPRLLDLGKLVPPDVTRVARRRVREEFERPVPPSAAFLEWLLKNPQRMRIRDPINFGTFDLEK